jgi:hypothetical protein
VQEGAFFRVKYNNDPIFASFDTAPSPHRRINAPSLLLGFAHIQGEAGTPTGGRRECGGGSEEPGSVCRRVLFPC